jgi:hypothetical protein
MHMPFPLLTHDQLLKCFRTSLRKRTWRRLQYRERALYQAALWYSKHQRIVNETLVAKLSALVEKLLETSGLRIVKRGQEKAAALLHRIEQNSVAGWVLVLKEWLKNPTYIFWLGMAGVNTSIFLCLSRIFGSEASIGPRQTSLTNKVQHEVEQ